MPKKKTKANTRVTDRNKVTLKDLYKEFKRSEKILHEAAQNRKALKKLQKSVPNKLKKSHK